jgi:hypothetical protein
LLLFARLDLPPSLTHYPINGTSYGNYDSNNNFEKNKIKIKSAQDGTHLRKLKKEIRSQANTKQQHTTNSNHF